MYIQVTDHQDIVITQDAMENANMGYLFVQIKKWIQELDIYREVHANFLIVYWIIVLHI